MLTSIAEDSAGVGEAVFGWDGKEPGEGRATCEDWVDLIGSRIGKGKGDGDSPDVDDGDSILCVGDGGESAWLHETVILSKARDGVDRFLELRELGRLWTDIMR